MPVFGYLLLLNEHVHNFLVIQYDAGWPFRYLPSLWRLWLLFYGSFFLAIGALLFSWRCPSEIKRFASPYALVDTERSHLTANLFGQRQIADNLANVYGNMSRWESSLFKLPRLKPELPNLGAGTSTELQTGDQWGLGLIHIWSVSDIKHPVWRIIILILFRAGPLLVGFPAAITFLQVTIIAARHLIAQI
jgi:hypothetical protein